MSTAQNGDNSGDSVNRYQKKQSGTPIPECRLPS
jgi:hypothetical protein